jgi:hypothetical protein
MQATTTVISRDKLCFHDEMDSFFLKVLALNDDIAARPDGQPEFVPFELAYNLSNEDVKARLARAVKINFARAGIKRCNIALGQLWTESVDDPLVRSVLVLTAFHVIDAMKI